VFDPLAVLLLIASQFTFDYERKQRAARKEKENDNQQPIESKPVESEPAEEVRTDQVELAETGGGDEGRSVAVPERGIEEQAVSVLEEAIEEPQKKSIESLEDSNNEAETEEEIARLESWNINDETFKDAKHNWKELHPEETIKFYKTLYIKGKIEQLPWEEEKYVQNSEQNENSLFKKIQDARKDE
jgi:hypothetical protein